MTQNNNKVRLKVSADVARILDKRAPREIQLKAARGALPLKGQDLPLCLLFLCGGSDLEIRSTARDTLKQLPAAVLATLLSNESVPSKMLDFIARLRFQDPAVMEALVLHPQLSDSALVYVASRCDAETLALVAGNDQRLLASPELVSAIIENPHAHRALKFRLGWRDPHDQAEEPGAESEPESTELPIPEGDKEESSSAGDEEKDNLSKFQQAIDMGVSDKIKMALTGDKEWRTIFLKDPNKLVSSAVLKNPRITEVEVLAVAKNRSANEDLIRLINLNREWVKNYEIKKALLTHPRTPLPKALRYLSVLSEKDLRKLAKSREVSAVLVNSARKLVAQKEKKS